MSHSKRPRTIRRAAAAAAMAMPLPVAAPTRVPSRSVFAALAGGLVLAAAGYAGVTWWARSAATPAATFQVVVGDGVAGPRDMVRVPGGEFLMGSDHKLAQANEKPAHTARVKAFWMDRHHVTNAQFRQFVQATGYLTTAERKPEWETIAPQVPAGTPRPPESALIAGGMVFTGTNAPVPDYRDYARWWSYVPGADWLHPRGPGSTIDGLDDHPVVQVSFEDAMAYAQWAGKRLPTEAEWEFAARGGLSQATYAWGDDFAPGGQQMTNVWQGQQAQPFPVVSPKAGGALGTSRVGTFPTNGYGLADMTGNAWQWVGDWYRADQFERVVQSGQAQVDPKGPEASWDPADPGVPVGAPKRVTRGGSFLCNEAFCMSYRPSARRGTDPYTSMSHLGFRLVMDEATWAARSGG